MKIAIITICVIAGILAYAMMGVATVYIMAAVDDADYVNSHYFLRREAISFNPGGFIGFAGWADDGNLNPLKRAFLEWCDVLKTEKEASTNE